MEAWGSGVPHLRANCSRTVQFVGTSKDCDDCMHVFHSLMKNFKSRCENVTFQSFKEEPCLTPGPLCCVTRLKPVPAAQWPLKVYSAGLQCLQMELFT